MHGKKLVGDDHEAGLLYQEIRNDADSFLSSDFSTKTLNLNMYISLYSFSCGLSSGFPAVFFPYGKNMAWIYREEVNIIIGIF